MNGAENILHKSGRKAKTGTFVHATVHKKTVTLLLHHRQAFTQFELSYFPCHAHATCEQSHEFIIYGIYLLPEDTQAVFRRVAGIQSQSRQYVGKRRRCDLLFTVAQSRIRIAMGFYDQPVEIHIDSLLRDRKNKFLTASDMTWITNQRQ